MNKPKEKLKSKEMLKILDNQWLDTNDVMKVGYVGVSKALSIKKEITDELLSLGIKTPRGLVPSEKVIDYFKINVNFLRKISNEKSMPPSYRESEHT